MDVCIFELKNILSNKRWPAAQMICTGDQWSVVFNISSESQVAPSVTQMHIKSADECKTYALGTHVDTLHEHGNVIYVITR